MLGERLQHIPGDLGFNLWKQDSWDTVVTSSRSLASARAVGARHAHSFSSLQQGLGSGQHIPHTLKQSWPVVSGAVDR